MKYAAIVLTVLILSGCVGDIARGAADTGAGVASGAAGVGAGAVDVATSPIP